MSNSPSKFEIDTNGSCLLCLTSSNCRIYDEKGNNLDSQTVKAFKKFLHFLKVDMAQVTLGLFDSNHAFQNVNLSVFLCDDCSSGANDFLDLYQKFENIRLQLDTSVGQLVSFMEKGVEDPDRVRESKKRKHAAKKQTGLEKLIVDRLRMEALGRANQRVQSALQRTRSYLNELGTELENVDEAAATVNAPPVPPRRNKKKLVSEVQREPDHDQAELRSSPEFQMCVQSDSEEDDTMSMDIFNEITREEAEKAACSALEIGDDDDISGTASVLEEDANMNHATDLEQQELEVTTTGEVQDTSSEPRNSSKRQWNCDYCDLKTSQKSNLVTHVFQQHALDFLSGELPPGATEQQLETSLAAILGEKERPFFQCPFCTKKFNTKRYGRVHLLQSHVREVIGQVENNFPTLVSIGVGEHSPSNNALKSKQVTRWKCISCRKFFCSGQNLRHHQFSRHLLAHLSSEGLLPSGISEGQLEKSVGGFLGRVEDFSCDVQCPICHQGKYKRRKYQLRTHILNLHLEQVLENAADDSGASTPSTIPPEDQ